MPSTFSITTANNNITLDRQGRSKSVTFTVTNSSGQALRGRGSLATTPDKAPHLAWLSPDGELERPFVIAGVEQYKVNITAPPDAAPGNYTFRLNMVATYNPDETFSEGPTVTIAVPEAPQKQPGKFPIWIIPVIVGVLAVLALILFLVLRPKTTTVPDLAGLSEDDAALELEDVGLSLGRTRSEASASTPLDHVVRSDPAAGAEVAKGSRVDIYLSSGPAITPTPTPTSAPPITPTPTPSPTPSLPLLANYPLQSDAHDISGQQADAQLTNAPFQDGGVFCNGVYVFNSGCQITTDNLNGFLFNSFTIEAEFKVSSLNRMPIFVGGRSWRWIGAYLNADGTTSLLYNNSNYAPCSTTVTPNTWHSARVTYDGAQGRLYIDGVLGCAAAFTLEQGGDSDVSVTNFSNATTFLGVIRNLRIYSAPLAP